MQHPFNRNDFFGIFTSFWHNRSLIFQMARREIESRYEGSMLGFLWSLLQPMIMLGVYTFVFSVVFKAKWGIDHGDKFEFAIVLFCGLIVYNLFAECVLRAPELIVHNAMYVKKVVFPLEIFPWISFCSNLFHALTSLGILLLFYFFSHFTLQWTIVFLPLVIFPMIFLMIGISWFLASLGVFLRDINQIIGIVTTALLFLSPVFYPISAVPNGMQKILFLNPLTLMIEQTREVVLWGKFPNWQLLAVYFLISFFIAWIGYFWFQKTRKGFADVL